MTAYRDAAEAKRNLLESLAAELRSIEARIFVPSALDAAYGAMSTTNVAWCEQRDRVMRADAQRATLDDAALDSAIETASNVVDQWRLLSKDVDGLQDAMMTPAATAPWVRPVSSPMRTTIAVSNGIQAEVIDEAWALPKLLTQRLVTLGCEDVETVWEVGPGILVAPWVLRAKARRNTTPYAIRFELWHRMGAIVSNTVASTSIPRARKPLSVVTRGAWWKRLVADRRTLGSETPTGDAELDDTYAVRGAGAGELVRDVRASLLVLLRCSDPELHAKDGVGTVLWTYDPEPEPLKATLALLDHLRSAPLDFSLRRDSSTPSPEDT